MTSADMGALNALIFGDGQFVLAEGNRFAASVVTNNQIRIADGEILMQGRHIRLEKNTYVDLTIENGTQGQYRNDLVVARYTKDSSTGVEGVNLVVIKGESVGSNPSDPAYTSGDILRGEALLNDMPLYRVPIDGLNVGELVPLFTLKDVDILGLEANKQNKTELLGAGTELADNDFFPFYDASANSGKKTSWSNIKAVLGKLFAPLSHNHAASNITSGTLPVERGGTGQTSLANLGVQLQAFGFSRVVCGAYVGNGSNNAASTRQIDLGFTPSGVLVIQKGNDWVNTTHSYHYSGLAVTGYPCTEPPIEIVTNGFTVANKYYNTASSYMGANANGAVYHYVAFS